MYIFPAIDLLDGKAVRLKQGRYEDPTIYSEDPVAQAKTFQAHSDRLHVVDLAGAKAGAPVQKELIRVLVRAHGGLVQVGGRVRSRDAFEAYLALGAKRVVLGTAAVKDPELVRALAKDHPNEVVLAVDAKDGFVATEGWTETSSRTAAEVVLALREVPIAAVLYTDVARDGMGAGPNIPAPAALAAQSPFPVIASGGVATLAQRAALAAIANVESAIVGRALYDGSLSLAELSLSPALSRSPT